MDRILNYLNDEEKVQLNGVRGGMFNNRSYWGYKSSVLKSGVCKYYRREMFDKFEWCVIEMMVMGLVNDGLFTNIINRMKILIMEEIVVDEFEIVSRSVKLFEILDTCDDYFKKVKIMKRICEVVKGCNKSRIVSYVNNWWKYNGLNDDEYKGIKLDKVLTFLAIFFAVVSPTCLIPIAYKTRSNGTFLLASIPAIKLVADFSAILSRGNNCSLETV